MYVHTFVYIIPVLCNVSYVTHATTKHAYMSLGAKPPLSPPVSDLLFEVKNDNSASLIICPRVDIRR